MKAGRGRVYELRQNITGCGLGGSVRTYKAKLVGVVAATWLDTDWTSNGAACRASCICACTLTRPTASVVVACLFVRLAAAHARGYICECVSPTAWTVDRVSQPLRWRAQVFY